MGSYKKRPCPGCGKVEPRPPQKLCRDCGRQLALGKRREEEIASLDTSGERVRIAIGTEFAYGIARRSAIGFLRFSHTDVVDALVRLAGLEDASGSGGTYDKAAPIHFTYSIPYHIRPRQFVWATAVQADSVKSILDYVHLVCKAWYTAGFEASRDLIRRLAEAGAADLNEITIGAGR